MPSAFQPTAFQFGAFQMSGSVIPVPGEVFGKVIVPPSNQTAYVYK